MSEPGARAALTTAALLAAALAAAEPPTLALSPGPHAVGFRVLNQRDASRRLADGSLRPVQVGVWYPAAPDPAAPAMRYRDYVRVAARERSLAPLAPADEEDALARYHAFLESRGLPSAGIDEWLAVPMLARADARAEGGRFPVVLLAAGTGGALPDQAALGEALAGHGYVAATTPSPVRLGARMEGEADVPVMAEEQARDLEIALGAVSARAWTDAERAGVVGYSFGARPALLLAGRRPALRALVSLDGGIGSAAAKGWLAPNALDRAALATPILHVYEEADDDARPDFALLASLTAAPRTLARVEGLRHLDFITAGLASASLVGLGGPVPARAEALRAVFAATCAFLDAHVAGRPSAWEALAGGDAGRVGPLRIVPFGHTPPSGPPSSRPHPGS
jgi:dienelactone hydrolase